MLQESATQGKWDGSFNKDPHLILYGMPDIPIQDKWALLALMGMCWDRRRLGMTTKDLEGPYRLSLREIAAITGVKHNALRSTGGKDPRTGVLDRWQEIGYITIMDARPIDEMTGKPGRMQTYLYIHLERIWEDNAAFTESWNRPPGRLVSEDSFERVVDATVHVVNTQETPLIGPSVNTTVHVVNNEVPTVNTNGHLANVTVHDASTNSDTRHSKKEKKKERKKEDKLATARPSIHSSSLSDDSLDKVREYAEGYGYDASKCQQRAQEIYQRYALSDDEFYSYLIEAYQRSKDMADIFTQLQLMLEGNFAKRG